MQHQEAVIDSIAEFILKNHTKLTYADINGEKCAFKSVSDALEKINPREVETLIIKGKCGVIGTIHLGGI